MKNKRKYLNLFHCYFKTYQSISLNNLKIFKFKIQINEKIGNIEFKGKLNGTEEKF